MWRNSAAPRRLSRGLWLHALLAFVLLAGWAPAVMAATPAQDDAQPLLLGQLGTRVLAAGESVAFTFDAPDDGLYVITSGDENEAAKFDMLLATDRGDEIYNDVFQTTELELDDGDHIITLTATEDGTASVFVTAQIGEMSEDYGDGEMINGGFVVLEGVETTQYATLEIEESDSWQIAFVILEGGEDGVYSASISGDNVYESISDSSSEAPLHFWTRGGDYQLQIDVVESGNSLTVIPLLSGAPPVLTLDEELEGELSAGNKEKSYKFTVEEPGRQVVVSLSSDSEAVDIDMVVSLNPNSDTWGSYSFGSEESVTFVAPMAGDYFVRAYTSAEEIEEPVPFTLLAELGEAAPTLEANSRVWDVVAAGSTKSYMINIGEAGQLLTVAMVGNPDVDLDLSAQMLDENGNSITSLSSYNSGSVELMSQVVQEPGMLQVTVNGGYTSEDTPFVLSVSLQAADEVAAQWATDATASSVFGEDGYSAMQATGEPNVSEAADDSRAWASEEADGTLETLELGFENAIMPTRVRIYESFNPGAVSMIEALDLENEEWVVLWEGSEAAEEAMRVFSPELEEADFATNRIRLTIDSDAVAGWNEIDAVQLLGTP